MVEVAIIGSVCAFVVGFLIHGVVDRSQLRLAQTGAEIDPLALTIGLIIVAIFPWVLIGFL